MLGVSLVEDVAHAEESSQVWFFSLSEKEMYMQSDPFSKLP